MVNSTQPINFSMNGNLSMRTHITFRYQTGLTLIEIMIALLIGVFLIGGILQIFLSTKQTYRTQENLSRLQENGRFAMDFISKDIRMTGYWGCLAASGAGGDITAIFDPGNPDAPEGVTLRGAFTATLTNLTSYPFTDPPALPPPAGITCGMALDNPVVTAAINPLADPNATITYQVGPGNLLQKTTNGQTNDLIEGVENMQILYGEDTDLDGVPNYYVNAGTAGLNMDQVVSIRISFLLHSIDDNVTDQPAPYNYNGTTGIVPPDRRIRRVFTSTIAVRNRIAALTRS